MSKMYGLKSEFAPLGQDARRTIICYGLQAAGDGTHYTWQQIVFYKKQVPSPTMEQIKDAVTSDIDARTNERIVGTLSWNGKPVWLSTYNQMDWKAVFDRALQTDGEHLPVKLKLGIDADGQPVYHTFNSLNAFADFTDTWQQHILQCLQDGWREKDNIDWSLYDPDGKQ